jgi:hypothetical protein
MEWGYSHHQRQCDSGKPGPMSQSTRLAACVVQTDSRTDVVVAYNMRVALPSGAGLGSQGPNLAVKAI